MAGLLMCHKKRQGILFHYGESKMRKKRLGSVLITFYFVQHYFLDQGLLELIGSKTMVTAHKHGHLNSKPLWACCVSEMEKTGGGAGKKQAYSIFSSILVKSEDF